MSQTNLQQIALSLTFIIAPLLCIAVMSGLSVVAGVCGALVLICYIAQEKSLPRFDKTLFFFLGGFLTLSASSAIWAEHPDFVIERTQRLAANFAGGYLLLSCLASYKPKTSMASLFLCALLPFLILLAYLFIEYNYFQIIYTLVKDIPYIFGTYITPTRLNWLMIAVIGLMWSLIGHLLFQKKKMHALIVFAVSFLIASQALSQSALLGIICSFLVFLSTYVLSKKHVKNLFIIGVIGLLFGLPLSLSKINDDIFYVDKTKTVYQLTSLEKYILTSSASERLQIWKFITKNIEKKPYIGHGIESTRFIKTKEKYQIVKNKTWRSVSHPHNGILQLWIEFGVLGVLFTSVFFIFLLNRIEKLPSYSFKAAVSTLAALFTVGSVGYGLWQGWWISTLFLCAAYCIMLTKIERNELHYASK